MSSDLYHQIVSQRGQFENLVARIPGFAGYHEKQARRTADRMLRDFLAGEIDKRISRFIRLEKRILDNGGLAQMPKTSEAKARMQLYHDKIATAAPKYSGMFAQVKITEDDLDRIYSFDEAQIKYIDRLDKALDALEAAVTGNEGVDAAIEAIHTTAQEALDAFALRDEVLTSLATDTGLYSSDSGL